MDGNQEPVTPGLRALAGLADEVEQGGRGEFVGAEGTAAPGQAGPMDPVQSLEGLLKMIQEAKRLGLHRVAAVWSDEVCHEVAVRVVAVLQARQQYPWAQSALRFLTDAAAPEWALAFVLVPVVIATKQAFDADRAALVAARTQAHDQAPADQAPAAP